MVDHRERRDDASKGSHQRIGELAVHAAHDPGHLHGPKIAPADGRSRGSREQLAVEVAGLVGIHAPAIRPARGQGGHAKAGFALGRSASAGKDRGSAGVSVVILTFTAGCRMLTWGVA
jgi:hypothetical protein